MIIPKDVKGKNKIRDAKILTMYLNGEGTYDELAQRFGISYQRIGKIIYQNRALIDFDKKHEQGKRVAALNRMLKKHPNQLGPTRDTLDIVKELRAETGDKEQSYAGGSTKVIIIREDKSGNQNKERSVPRPLSVFKV